MKKCFNYFGFIFKKQNLQGAKVGSMFSRTEKIGKKRKSKAVIKPHNQRSSQKKQQNVVVFFAMLLFRDRMAKLHQGTFYYISADIFSASETEKWSR